MGTWELPTFLLTLAGLYIGVQQLRTSRRTAYLRPIRIRFKDRGFESIIKVRNFSPEVATEVKVTCIQMTGMSPIPTRSGPLMVWVTSDKKRARGPVVIEPSAEAEYDVGHLLQRYPVLISWKTAGARKSWSAWQISYRERIDDEDRIEPLSWWGRIRFEAFWLWLQLLTPCRIARKWWLSRQNEPVHFDNDSGDEVAE